MAVKPSPIQCFSTVSWPLKLIFGDHYWGNIGPDRRIGLAGPGQWPAGTHDEDIGSTGAIQWSYVDKKVAPQSLHSGLVGS